MNQSENIQDLIKALIAAQQEFETINKNLTGQAGQGKFKYADLTEVYNKTKPALFKHGLTCVSLLSGDKLSLTLYHVSGQFIKSEIEFRYNEKPTNMGAFLTYMRRYLYSSMLNIAADEDVEGDDLNSTAQEAPKVMSDSDVLKLSLEVAKKMQFSNTDKLAEYLMKFKKHLSSVANPLDSLCSDKFVSGYEKWLAENPPSF